MAAAAVFIHYAGQRIIAGSRCRSLVWQVLTGKLVVSVDNQLKVSIINSNHSREAHLMHLLRLLVFYACHYNFWFKAEHIPGKKSTLADTLSRNNVSYFLSLPIQGATSSAGPLITRGCLDVHSLDGAVQAFFVAALAKTSHWTYETAGKRFLRFCHDFALT